MKTQTKETIYSILLIIVPLSFLFGVYFYRSFKTNSLAKQNQEVAQEEDALEKAPKNPFEEIDLIAQSVIVKDLSTGQIIYEKNSEEIVPLASLTKVMTALVIELFNQSKIDRTVTISAEAIKQDGDNFLRPGEKFDLEKIIKFTMITSSNDGAAAIAEAVQNINNNNSFADKMNEVAKNIGMKNTHFFNETGLDEDEKTAGAFGSAHDIAKLMEYTLKNYPEIFEGTRDKNYSVYSENGILHQASNTNTIASELPNLLASKTGYTDLAGGNLAVIVDPSLNKPIVIVVLGSTFDGRFEDVVKISNGLSEYFQYKN